MVEPLQAALSVLSLFGLVLLYAFKTLRPLFRERSKINAEVSAKMWRHLLPFAAAVLVLAVVVGGLLWGWLHLRPPPRLRRPRPHKNRSRPLRRLRHDRRNGRIDPYASLANYHHRHLAKSG